MKTTLELDIERMFSELSEETIESIIDDVNSEWDDEEEQEEAEGLEIYGNLESCLEGISDWRGLVDWREFENAVYQFGYEIAEIAEGCLVDSYLVYLGENRALVGFEYAVSGWTSKIKPVFYDNCEEAEAEFGKLFDEYEQVI